MWLLVLGVAVLLAIVAVVVLVAMRRGGTKEGYRTLIDALVDGDPRCRVEEESGGDVRLTLSTSDGDTSFRLVQTVWHLIVTWENDSPVTGSRRREWKFPKYTSQRAMLDRIYDDLLLAHREMMRS